MSSTKQTIQEIFALRRNGYSGPFFQGLVVFVIGVWILAAGNGFENPKYKLMEEFASPVAWGSGLILCSVLIIIGSLARKPREVAVGSMIIGAAWLLMFASFFIAEPESPINGIARVMILRCTSLFREFKTQFDPVTGKPLRFDSQGEPQ